jgi:hypothetical protein
MGRRVSNRLKLSIPLTLIDLTHGSHACFARLRLFWLGGLEPLAVVLSVESMEASISNEYFVPSVSPERCQICFLHCIF